MAAVKIDLKAVVPQLLGQSGPVPTAELVRVYEKLRAEGKNFEVVFVSSDRNEAQFKEYFSHMPWLAVPYAHAGARSSLASACGVVGIPQLTVLGPDGSVVAPCARGAVGADPSGAGFPWAGAKSAGGGGFLRLIIMFLLLWVLSRFFTGK